MTGAFSSPQLAGSLQVDDFDVTLPATAEPMNSNALGFSFRLASAFLRGIALHNATLRRDDTSAEFDASATLEHGHFTGDSTFNLRANLHNAELAAPPGSRRIQLSCLRQGRSFCAGRRHSLRSSRRTDKSISPMPLAYGETVRQFDSNFHVVRAKSPSITCISSTRIPSSLEAPPTILPPAPSISTLLATISISPQFPQIHSDRLSVEGRADFILKGSGTPEAPSINGGRSRSQSDSRSRTRRRPRSASALPRVANCISPGIPTSSDGSLLVSGNVQLRDDYPANLSLQMDQLDLDALWHSYFRGQLTGHSAVAGSLDLRGPLRQPGNGLSTAP